MARISKQLRTVPLQPADENAHEIGRRTFLASAALAAGSGIILAGSPPTAAAAATSDLLSGDKNLNPAFPYASDGLLFNFVNGTVTSVGADTLAVFVNNLQPPREVTIAVPQGTEVFCRGDLSAPLATVQVGDRVDVGTKFVAQGRREATWVVANGCAGWSNVVATFPDEITVEPSAAYGSSAGNAALRVVAATRIHMPDGKEYIGDASRITVGDPIYWTGISDVPSRSSAPITAIFIVHTGEV